MLYASRKVAKKFWTDLRELMQLMQVMQLMQQAAAKPLLHQLQSTLNGPF
jgi:hypothetical protein